MATQPPNITPTPTPAPQRGDRTTFSGRVDAFIMWLTTAVGQFAAVATNVYNNAAEAFQSALTATAQANAALAVAGVQVFNPSKAYAAGEAAYSLINGQTYRRITAGTSATNPANDQVNWRLLSGSDVNGAFVPISVPALNIDLSQGNYFSKSISSNSAFTFSNVPAGGSSFTLDLTLTAAVLATFPTSVRTPNNAPLPFVANKSYLCMFITKDGGARWRLVVAPNFDI